MTDKTEWIESPEVDLLRKSWVLKDDLKICIFGAPSTQNMIDEIIDENPKLFSRGQITWEKFEDGFPNLFIKDVKSIVGKHVVYIASFLNHMELLSQLSVLYSLPRYMIKTLTVVMPYFPTGTMERVDEEGQIATAMTFARLLSNIPLSIGGPTRMVVFDIHALQNRFYFTDSVLPFLTSAIPLFIDALKKNHKGEKIVIAFPDDGAAKRFGKLFKNFPLITCLKIRENDKRVVTVKEGVELIKDAHIFIIDDLVKTGGTLIETKNKLYELGAAAVSAYVSHAVFPQDSWKKFVEKKDNQFKAFYTTDSCPETLIHIKGKEPFKILKLAPVIARMLQSELC